MFLPYYKKACEMKISLVINSSHKNKTLPYQCSVMYAIQDYYVKYCHRILKGLKVYQKLTKNTMISWKNVEYYLYLHINTFRNYNFTCILEKIMNCKLRD